MDEEKRTVQPRCVDMPFALTSKVMPKKIGHPVVGLVIGYELAEAYYNNILKRTEHHVWNDLYPDWRTKVVIVLGFKNPQKICTIEELRTQYPALTEEQIQESYQTQVAVVDRQTYPIDDIELFDDSYIKTITDEEYQQRVRNYNEGP